CTTIPTVPGGVTTFFDSW
nr:immunoglobulin heavy chain junction region [Macaca mulatta]MOW24307.1 immunoglobulin heavy chain junction region [Macaca mulatta]MOW24714.1 immunoglobulin heavy chain junction region [Macaca mulatta]MOW24851.1 immunoglobulin heavy chain junction region [Macaca mulatta]MOW25237.1 immunoglobulin heavy chain junction region [Macaca mulatta]